MMYDIIVFDNLRFCPSTRKRKAGVFKNVHYGERFLKICVFGDRFQGIREDGRSNPEKKNIRFQTKTDTCGWALTKQS